MSHVKDVVFVMLFHQNVLHHPLVGWRVVWWAGGGLLGWRRNMSCDQWLVLGKRLVTKCYEWLWVVVVLKIQS